MKNRTILEIAENPLLVNSLTYSTSADEIRLNCKLFAAGKSRKIQFRVNYNMLDKLLMKCRNNTTRLEIAEKMSDDLMSGNARTGIIKLSAQKQLDFGITHAIVHAQALQKSLDSALKIKRIDWKSIGS